MSGLAHREPPPTAKDAALARQSGQQLSELARRKRPLTLKVVEPELEHPLELPAGAVSLLMDILEAMAAGRGVTIIPENAELTSVQAAAVLNVSRPFLIGLLDAKAIPYRKVGKHRRLLMEDVMAYKQRIDAEREAVLDDLVAEAQKHDLGYGR